MKRYKKKKRGSIFSLLISNYIAFTVAIVLTVMLITYLGMLLFTKQLNIPVGLTEKEQELLSEEKYDELKLKKIAGVNGQIDILDENNNVIYHLGDGSVINRYSERELNYIREYDGSGVYTYAYKFRNNGEELILLLKNKNLFNNEYSNDMEYDVSLVEVIDKDLNVIYRAGDVEDTSYSSYTKEELGYLLGTYPEKYEVLKFSFTNKLNEKRTMIIKEERINEERFQERLDFWSVSSIVTVGIVYIICTIIFVMALRKKVKRPLEKLEGAMYSLAEGKSRSIIDYSGPKEFVQICDAFNIMVNKLEDSEVEKDRLTNDKQRILSDISHDLKTPITTIQGYSKALVDGVISEEDLNKYLKIIYTKSTRLNELINMFYEYSKVEHPDFQLILNEVDLSEYFRSYLAIKYEDILDTGFDLDVDIPDEVLLCNIDKVQFLRVLDNLLGNAIKHNPKGTTIYFKLIREKYNYKIILADNGVGISEEIAKNIFDAFTVGDESRTNKEGSGLGLAIVKKIVEMHKGNIRLKVSNDKEYATIFEIIIPK
ncbi:HAMP domain-containing histidine kinase [Clostridium sp. NSJ-6]|uniref:histidine kinase n=1 Tax=Clostridium hominis TaxID=2763036 RepID=A0ABR7DCB8_9CLOT|nr:HAMP domain-containing sensor histidine kinase [Clostridium hominis]MBC5629035.1 HAMP domain-containing histidine kinase [Clostridium hominis]MDU2671905.1 HAMP domain-containing sensor histidine kinase [Clostridium sp.]